MKHTKIVATISDIRCDIEFLQELYNEGLNVVRMNTAHMDYDGIKRIVTNVRAVSDKIAILIDTKGPEVRTTKCEGTLEFSTGDVVRVVADSSVESTKEKIAVSYEGMVTDVNVGNHILIDDGEVDLEVTGKEDDALVCVATNNGSVGARKSVNVPGVRINLPSLTEKDRTNIQHAIEFDIDFIAHSFVRNLADVQEIQDILDEKNSKIKVIAKIENQEGVDNVDEILEGAYGIMVARGDLGIEVAQERIPGIQRQLIRTCVKAKKPVIVATQMLHTMIKNPRPTRAEVADIANAIYYRTDAVMLSGETAYGAYPVEALRAMAKIAEEAEKSKLTENDIRIPSSDDERSVTAFLSKQAVRAAGKVGCEAIINNAVTGGTARNLAAFRGKNPVYALCTDSRIMRELALSYGVFASLISDGEHTQSMEAGVAKLIADGKIDADELVAFVGGNYGVDSTTTSLEINSAKTIAAKKNW